MKLFINNKTIINLLLTVLIFAQSCNLIAEENSQIIVGAERTEIYFPLLEGKKIAVVANHTSMIKNTHLVDSLFSSGINLRLIFCPEHGFRGTAYAGEEINNNIDSNTGLPVVSLYGEKKKPNEEDLMDIDIVLFDIQDVGVRFYTYISTMHYIMEACAENEVKLIILDRPNPNGDYVDGPVLDIKFRSFVGMHPIPVVHGLTVGELAQMINGENWLIGSLQCDLEVIRINNYSHSSIYSVPIKPSPNLPNDISIRLYPSLCFFEATEISIGRGTNFPFQVIGYPDESWGDFYFVPQNLEGIDINPKQLGEKCYGIDLRNEDPRSVFSLKYLIDFYNKSNFKDTFFSRIRWIQLLSGNDKLRSQIEDGKSEKEIRESWVKELELYKAKRKKYLLYEDFTN